MKEYDYLIVGAGLYGGVFAHEVSKKGKKCLVIDKRDHAGGNVYCENEEGINVHKYGAHIFHTNSKEIWDYVNSFVEFNRYTNSPLAFTQGKLYNLPFNMNTFYQMWGVKTPDEAREKIRKECAPYVKKEPSNLEEQALSLVGPDIYEKLIKGYTEKQWGRKATELPSFIIKRIPLRFTYDNNYFDDQYQGIPIGGYNTLIRKLLDKAEVRTGVDFFADREYWKSISNKIVYTGLLDEFFEFKFGELSYRSLRFEHSRLEISDFQGNAVINYTDAAVPFTRILEHKHFEFGRQSHTIITREYPQAWSRGFEPYYPVNDEASMRIFKMYEVLAKQEVNVIFGGRLADYRYYDMHQVIGSALKKSRSLL